MCLLKLVITFRVLKNINLLTRIISHQWYTKTFVSVKFKQNGHLDVLCIRVSNIIGVNSSDSSHYIGNSNYSCGIITQHYLQWVWL